MKYLTEILCGLILIASVYVVMNNIGSSKYNGEVVNRSIDTVWAKPDTVLITNTVYIPKLKAVLDTVYIDSVKTVVASADTVIKKDSSKIGVKYFFPPLNYFEVDLDLKEKVITKQVTILDSVTVEVKKPFYEDHWFWTSIAAIAVLIASLLGRN
jgi:hypothetical protein